MAKPNDLSYSSPRFFDTLVTQIEDHLIKSAFRNLFRELEKMQRQTVESNNLNQTAIKSVSQNGIPTVPDNEIWLWEDADATSGNPTHYLVATDADSNTITFASEELVP